MNILDRMHIWWKDKITHRVVSISRKISAERVCDPGLCSYLWWQRVRGVVRREKNEDQSWKKLYFMIRKQVFLYKFILTKGSEVLLSYHWRIRINFKTLKLVKPNNHLPANFIPKSLQLIFLSSSCGNIGNSVNIPLILLLLVQGDVWELKAKFTC